MSIRQDEQIRPRRVSRASQFLHGPVANALRERVLQGDLGAETKLPPLRKLANEFDVSTMTIRRAIHTLEQEGHVYRIPAVGVFVNHNDRRSRRTENVGVFAAIDLSSPFEVALARGIEKACQKQEWDIRILDAHCDPRRERRNLQRLTDSNVRGAIVLPTCEPANLDALIDLKRSRFPFVLVDRSVPGLNADLVESDHEMGAYRATEYLIEQGHSPVLMVTATPTVVSEVARIRGYAQALKDANIQPLPGWKIQIDLDTQMAGDRQKQWWRGGYEAVLPVLKTLKPPLGIFAHNDRSGWGVYEACRELGLRIPDDVSIVCFDDSEVARAMTPPTTAIAQRTDEIGRAAVELLKRRCQTKGAVRRARQVFTHTVIDVDLIERGSVRPCQPNTI